MAGLAISAVQCAPELSAYLETQILPNLKPPNPEAMVGVIDHLPALIQTPDSWIRDDVRLALLAATELVLSTIKEHSKLLDILAAGSPVPYYGFRSRTGRSRLPLRHKDPRRGWTQGLGRREAPCHMLAESAEHRRGLRGVTLLKVIVETGTVTECSKGVRNFLQSGAAGGSTL